MSLLPSCALRDREPSAVQSVQGTQKSLARSASQRRRSVRSVVRHFVRRERRVPLSSCAVPHRVCCVCFAQSDAAAHLMKTQAKPPHASTTPHMYIYTERRMLASPLKHIYVCGYWWRRAALAGLADCVAHKRAYVFTLNRALACAHARWV